MLRPLLSELHMAALTLVRVSAMSLSINVYYSSFVTGYEKRDHIAHLPNFRFKMLISLEP
jgi:hypothetical protein